MSANPTNDALKAVELLDKRIEAAGEATRKAQDAAREAREAVAGLGSERKALEALKADIQRLVGDQCKDLIRDSVTEDLKVMGGVIEESMDTAVERVNSRFAELEKLCLGFDDPKGRISIPDMLAQAREVLSVEWPRLMQYITAARAMAAGCGCEDDGVACPGVVKWAVRYTMKLADGKTGEGHIHCCHKHYREYDRDASITITAVFRLVTDVCPFEHDGPTPRHFYDTETGVHSILEGKE